MSKSLDLGCGLQPKYVFSPPALTARMPAHPVDSDVA